MEITEFAKSLFNENNISASLLVLEQSKSPIFKDRSLKIKLGTVDDITYKSVIINKVMGNDFYQIKFNSMDAFVSLKDVNYILLLPKKKIQVKMSKSISLENNINLLTQIDKDTAKQIEGKICYSSHYAIYNDNLFEAILYKDEIIAFTTGENFSVLLNQTSSFQITNESSTFKDSDLTKYFGKIKAGPKSFESQLINTENNAVRFKFKNKKVWLPISETNLKVEGSEYIPQTPSEAFIKSIINQYDIKLENSNMYYLKILNRELKGKTVK